ncbi:MAG: pentapeptide repeat-containing protein [Chloroflexota bacterium]|nr:pentapeptide repeat-containing protein [Chloroflexota bacterium]
MSVESRNQYSDQIFNGVKLDHSNLNASEFSDCTFNNCSLVEVLFIDCRFVNCRFQDCDLSLVQFQGTILYGVKFEVSKLIGIDWTLGEWSALGFRDSVEFHKCSINHSTFIGLELNEVMIRDCSALDVDFREADLTQANFSGTDLSGSLFINTNLTGADLSRARNYHIKPEENVLIGAKFSLPEAMSLLYNMDIVLADVDS